MALLGLSGQKNQGGLYDGKPINTTDTWQEYLCRNCRFISP
jgi:hypothetical protein